jgi:hypothetical protein
LKLRNLALADAEEANDGSVGIDDLDFPIREFRD